MIAKIENKTPKIADGVYIASNAAVIGDVAIGKNSSVWFGAVIRGDSNSMTIGSQTNVQDLCVLHVDSRHPLIIGDAVTIGHRAILHGCTIENNVLIGMGATIMNGAVIGKESIVGAGALVTEDTEIPPRSLVLGFPAKVKRALSEEEIGMIATAARHYAERARVYREGGFEEIG